MPDELNPIEGKIEAVVDVIGAKGEVITKKPGIEETKSLDIIETAKVESCLKALPVFEGESQDFINFKDYAKKDEEKIFIEGRKVVGFTATRNLIHKHLKPAKNDYKNDFSRGSVEYTEKCSNYSYHKVTIPDGTVINERNFTQAAPDTECIVGENLVFNHCNLCNVKINPSWVLNGCLVMSKKETLLNEDGEFDEKNQKSIRIMTEVKGNGMADYEMIEERDFILNEETIDNIKMRIEVQNGSK